MPKESRREPRRRETGGHRGRSGGSWELAGTRWKYRKVVIL